MCVSLQRSCSLPISFYSILYRTLLYLLWPLDSQITKKCLPPVLELKYLEDLVLEGCSGVDDDSLSALKQGCKSLQVLIIRELIALSRINCTMVSFCHSGEKRSWKNGKSKYWCFFYTLFLKLWCGRWSCFIYTLMIIQSE